MENIFYVGSVALNYWSLKYFNCLFKISKDKDISSVKLDFKILENQYYPEFDVVPLNKNNIFKYEIFNNDGFYIEDNNINYATPEYLIMTYYERMIRTNYNGKKFFADLSKIRFLKTIIEKRGYLDKFFENFKKLNLDTRLFFSLNNYIYRCLPFIYTDEIVGGEFALMCHYEINNKYYELQSLDIDIYNTSKKEKPNTHGSKIICHNNSVPFIDYNGLKIQSLDSLKNEYPKLNYKNL